MSDESQPPALRLKPRLRTGNEPAPATSAAGPASPATESADGGTGAESGNRSSPVAVPLPAVPAAPVAVVSGEKSDGLASPEPRVRLKPRLAINPQPGANQVVSDRLPEDMGGTPMPRGTGVPPVGLSGHSQPDFRSPQPAIPAVPSSEVAAPPAVVVALPVEPPPLSLPPLGVRLPVEKPSAEVTVLPPAMGASAAEAAGKFKLKPKAPAPVPSEMGAAVAPAIGEMELPPVAAATLPSPLSVGSVPVAAPPPPVENPLPAKLTVAPHVPHIRAPGEEMPLPESAPSPFVPPQRRRISKPRLMFAALVGIGIVACVGYYARRAFPSSPPASKIAAKPVLPSAGQGAKATPPQAGKNYVTPAPASMTPASPGPTPSDTLNQIAAAPKQAIDRAKDAVAARRGNEQARIDAMAAGEEAPDKRALDTPPPSRFANQSPSPDATARLAPVPGTGDLIAPGVTATTSDVAAAPKASTAFKRFVADARITGVFQGTPPRALINGRMIRAGEVVDKTLGVVFDSIDSEEKTITFKDRAGIPATRKY